jgi:protein-L-isoaspartate(D-aspartate) O-methyltransferase
MALDGSKIATLRISLSVKYENVKAGTDSQEQAGLVIYFFDAVRRRLDNGQIGPWSGTQNWHPLNVDVPVPPRAKEAVISIGLHGGTGTLCVDAVRLTPKPR